MKRLFITGIISNALALALSVFLIKGFSAFKPLEVDFGEYCLFMLILIWLAATSTWEHNGTTRADTVLTDLELKRDKPAKYITSKKRRQPRVKSIIYFVVLFNKSEMLDGEAFNIKHTDYY